MSLCGRSVMDVTGISSCMRWLAVNHVLSVLCRNNASVAVHIWQLPGAGIRPRLRAVLLHRWSHGHRGSAIGGGVTHPAMRSNGSASPWPSYPPDLLPPDADGVHGQCHLVRGQLESGHLAAPARYSAPTGCRLHSWYHNHSHFPTEAAADKDSGNCHLCAEYRSG